MNNQDQNSIRRSKNISKYKKSQKTCTIEQNLIYYFSLETSIPPEKQKEEVCVFSKIQNKPKDRKSIN
jgi:hypothetical protein